MIRIQIQLIMKNNLQRKIAQFKQQKSKKGILQNLISQKRKNLERLVSQQVMTPIEKQNDFRIENYAKQIDFAQQKYFDDMEQLQNIKFKIIELRGVYETLQLEIRLQEDNLTSCKQSYKRQFAANQEIIEKTKVRMINQREQKLKMFEERCDVHVQQVVKLTDEKEKFINNSGQLVEKLKSLDFKFKQLKDKFQDRFRKEKQNWAKTQQQRRQKWEQKKMQQITQNTLKGLEPAIQKIVNNSKKQIFETQQKYQSLKNEFKAEMNQQYQKNLQCIKKSALGKIQQEKTYFIQNSDKLYRELAQKLMLTQQAQISRVKAGKEAQIRELQERRKKETQYFMLKNKDFLMSHLNQIKQIKSSYQKQIKELDTSLDKLLEKQEKLIRQKYQQKTQKYRQQKRKVLQQKIKTFHIKQKQESETLYEDMIQNVACQNQVFQTQLKLQTENKIKQFKQNHQNQMKNLRKTQQSLLNKQNFEKEALNHVSQVKNNIQLQYNQLIQQCQYLKKKQIQFQSEVMNLKTKQDDFIKFEVQQIKNAAHHWSEQIQILVKKKGQIQTEMQTQQKVMKQKSDEEKNKYTSLLNSLDKNSLQILKKINQQIERGRKQKQMKIVLHKKLLETKKKMKELELKKKSQYKI